VQNPPLKRFDVWGPQMKDMHAGLQQVFAGDIASREFMAGQTPFHSVVHGHTVNLERGNHRIVEVFSDNNVKVSAMRVYHGSHAEMPYAYAYRFDLKASGKSVVFSGDTTPTDGMSKLAADCDLLVHEAMYLPGVDQVVQLADPSVRTSLRTHLLSTHTTVEDIPKVAKNANAKRVVMTHLVPAFIPPAAFAATARAASGAVGYAGEVAVAKDLDVIAV
jgi:ribonuclease BN (tRNA processing enzyme)